MNLNFGLRAWGLEREAHKALGRRWVIAFAKEFGREKSKSLKSPDRLDLTQHKPKDPQRPRKPKPMLQAEARAMKKKRAYSFTK